MTFLDKLHQLQVKAVAADDEEQVKRRSGDFVSLRERLQAATMTAGQVVEGWAELESAGIVLEDYEQNRVSALAAVKSLMATVESLSVEAKFDEVKRQYSAIEAHFRKSEKSVFEAWRHHLAPTPPPVDDAFINALEQAGVDVESIRSDIERARGVLTVLGNRGLPRRGDIAELERAWSTLASITSRIGEVIDPVIADVVVRAQDGGVPYTRMTPEVVSALESLGILDRFRVVLR